MALTTSLRKADVAAVATPLLIVAVPQGAMPPSLGALDAAAGGALARLYATRDFTGKKDQVASVYPAGPVARILLVGAGDTATVRSVRRAASVAGKRARLGGVKDAVYYLTPEARGRSRKQTRCRLRRRGWPTGPGTSTP